MPDGGYALSGLRVWANFRAMSNCLMAATPYQAYTLRLISRTWLRLPCPTKNKTRFPGF
jgi:hypothetical protein